MEFEKDLRFKLMIFRKYKFNFEKYLQGKEIREFYMQKKRENGKKRNLKMYEEILSFIGAKDIDKERFYYIYFEYACELYKLERYDEACMYFKIAIDNVISDSYRKNRSKLKSAHFKLFLEKYSHAVDCFIKAEKFVDADYYDELNMYFENKDGLSNSAKGNYYAELGAREVAIKYYEKVIEEIDGETIVRHYDYDPYTNGYLEEEYNRKVAEKEERKQRYIDKINSL